MSKLFGLLFVLSILLFGCIQMGPGPVEECFEQCPDGSVVLCGNLDLCPSAFSSVSTPSQAAVATATPVPTATRTTAPEPTATPEPTPTVFVAAGPEDITGLLVETNSNTFRPSDEMNITISFNASRPLSHVKIALVGITNYRGHHYLNQQAFFDLLPGENEYMFTQRIPSCSTCSGLSYGEYSVDVTLSQNDEVLAAYNHTIEIVQSS